MCVRLAAAARAYGNVHVEPPPSLGASEAVALGPHTISGSALLECLIYPFTEASITNTLCLGRVSARNERQRDRQRRTGPDPEIEFQLYLRM